MKTEIKSTSRINNEMFKVIWNRRAVLAAALVIAAGVLLSAVVLQPKVSGQEMFDLPKLEILPAPNSNLSNSAVNRKENLDIAYLSAEKDSQLIEKFDRLISKADAEGSVPVIVGFRFDFTLDGDLTDSRIADQRSAIKQEQTGVLQKIEDFEPKNVKQFETIPYFAATVDAATLRYLRSLPEITSISEDGLSAPTLNQSVPLVGAPKAWSAGYTGNGWKVAILDTGVDSNHFFLYGKVFSEACYSTTSGTIYSSLCPGGAAQSTAAGSGINCDTAIYGCDHGTHVAGIAAGDDLNIHGVAKYADLISIKVFSRLSSNCGSEPAPCAKSFDSDQILGLERVLALRNSFAIASVNMSLGGGGSASTCDTTNPAETTAITNLRSVDIATVIASGNDSSSGHISFPACISTAVSVGSTGDGSGGATVDQVSSFSNSTSSLKLLAPGSLITSSVPGNAYADKSGTSMAAPHVAGAWAILKQKFPNATVDTILNALTSTGLPILDARNNITKPRIRIDAALRNLSGGTCGYSLNPAGSNWGRGGGSNTFIVNATESDCGWTATSNSPSWLTITSGASGTGDGQVNYAVATNNTTSLRTGTIIAGGQTFTVTQQGDCVTAISPISQSVGNSTYNSAITVTTTSGCTWAAQRSVSWISFIGQSSGTGSGSFGYAVAANTSGATRTGTITVGSKTMTVTQSGTFTTCTTSTPIAFGQTINGSLATSDCFIAGQPGRYVDPYSFTGTAGQQIAITMRGAGSFFPILYLETPDGQRIATDSAGTVRLPANSGSFFTLPVSGTYTINAASSAGGVGNYSLILNDGATCGNSSISPSSQSFTAAGGSGSINLTINSGCAWETSRNFGWLTLTSGIAGTGSGAVNYTVEANSTGASRTQTITVNGLPFVVTQNGTAAPTARKLFDFDGDGKADVSVFRPGNGVWYLQQSTAGFTGIQFGQTADQLAAADYDGDGKTDLAVFRSGTWYIQRSTLGFTGIQFGSAADIPAPADYDGDGKADIAVFRPSNGTWYISGSTAGFYGVAFGQNGDLPVAADYDGDGKTDIAVNRGGIWYIQRSQAGFIGIAFGAANDKCVPADYDGDGKADVAVFRPSNGTWYINGSTAGFYGAAFGQNGDQPVAADYDGDGKTDIAVFRPSNGTWYRLNSSNGAFVGLIFGLGTDKPIPAAFIP